MTPPAAPTRRAALLGAGGLALAACSATPPPPLPGPPKGRVVLLRGLINVFSTGMDDLGAKLRGAGYDATVHNHLDWLRLADEAVAQAREGRLPRPFAVVGHSLGADDGIRLGARVGQATGAADLVVTFDPVLVTRVPPGPSRVLNYFQRTDFWGHGLSAERGFAGILENQPLDGENHFTIDKDPALHREVLDLLEFLRLRSVSLRFRPTGPRTARMPVPPRPPVRAAR